MSDPCLIPPENHVTPSKLLLTLRDQKCKAVAFSKVPVTEQAHKAVLFSFKMGV